MVETIEIGGLLIDVIRKGVKNVHLSVHPPDGRVTLVAPSSILTKEIGQCADLSVTV